MNDVGLGSSFLALAVTLVFQMLIVIGILLITRPFLLWLFGVRELIEEVRALRAELARRATQAATRETTAPPPGSGRTTKWPD